jgi:hypothetical protein
MAGGLGGKARGSRAARRGGFLTRPSAVLQPVDIDGEVLGLAALDHDRLAGSLAFDDGSMTFI